MSKGAIGIAAFINVVLAVLYGWSEGPYVDIGDRKVRLASELMSSGGNSGLLITLALMTFSISFFAFIACVAGWIGRSALAKTYAVNYLIYGSLILAVQLDISLAESIKFGDWLLLSALVLPAAPLIIGIVNAARRNYTAGINNGSGRQT